MNKKLVTIVVVIVSVVAAILLYQHWYPGDRITESNNDERIVSGSFDEEKLKVNDRWREVLTPQQFNILREAGTEAPFTGELDKEYRKGTYYSIGCDLPVFRSEQKYDSGTGWPSFWAPIDDKALVLRKQSSVLGVQIEVLDRCGGHLGHMFDDGPLPTGKRYCMNSAALRFVLDEE